MKNTEKQEDYSKWKETEDIKYMHEPWLAS